MKKNMRKLASFFRKKNHFCIFILLLVLFVLFPPSTTATKHSAFKYSPVITHTPSHAYAPHPAILILSDQNFTDYGFPGTGTEEDPYRIENYFINVTEVNHAIAIYHTSKRFIVQNCYLMTNGEGMYSRGAGIYIENTTYSRPIIRDNVCVDCDSWGIRLFIAHYATIINNTCINNSKDGINVWGSAEPIVTNNTCVKNQGGGIVIIGATDAIIENNICEENEVSGIYLGSVSFQIYSRNRCENNKMYGMIFTGCDGTITENYCANNSLAGIRIGAHLTLVNNTCYGNRYGIYTKESFYSYTLNNTCINNDYGLFIDQGSWYNTVANNTIINSTYDGIYARWTRELLVLHNRIENSKGFGVYLEGWANDSVIAYNSFINNNPGGVSQGCDDGFRNTWYDKETKRGNYWKDYEGKGSYAIAGRAEAKDKYPLTENMERVHNVSPYWALTSLVVLPVSILLTILCKRKKNYKCKFVPVLEHLFCR